MKHIILSLSLIFILLLSGCLNQGKGEKGGPGIIITDFSVDYSPAYAGEQIGLNLEVINRGEYQSTIHRIEFFGVGSDWGLPEADTKGYVLAAADPTIGFEGGTYARTVTLNIPSTISSTANFDLGVRVEYDYQTEFTGTIRVMDRNYLRTLPTEEREKFIQTGGFRESSSTASPLSVSTASGSHFITTGSTRQIRIPFRITNVGSGLPYSYDSSSVNDAVTNNKLYEIQVINARPSNLISNCDSPITLSRGKNGGFGCTLTLPSAVTNYADYTFSLTLRYKYYVDGSTSLTVNPQYGAVTTVETTVATTVLDSCGNNVIDSGENCENCPADVSCPAGQQCCPGGTCSDVCP